MGATIGVGIKKGQQPGWLTIALDAHSLEIDWQEAIRLIAMLTSCAAIAASKAGVSAVGVHAAVDGALVEAEMVRFAGNTTHPAVAVGKKYL